MDKMRFWATQAKENFPYYQHEEYGYNYRMGSINAAMGLGQLEFLPEKIARRKHIHWLYAKRLPEIKPWGGESNHWLTLMWVKNPLALVETLAAAGIEARHAWKPMHMQPVFAGCKFFFHLDKRPFDEEVFAHAVCLPSGDGMTDEDVEFVISEVVKAIV